MSSRSAVATTVLFFAALVALCYWPVFTGRVPLATDDVNQFPPFRAYYEMSVRTRHAELGDTITEVYPWRKFAAEAVRHGVIPLWNPNLLAGAPFQANSLTALFYPVTLIFFLLPMPIAWSLAMMLKVLLAATFTFLFLREIGASRSGAIVGATAFAFGGVVTAWLAWPRTDATVWLPLLCFQIHRLCRQPSRRQAALLAVIIAMPILAGHPGTAAHIFMTVAAYGVFIVAVGARPLTDRAHSVRQVTWLAAAGFLALGLAAVQIFPTVEWLTQIFRTLDMPGSPLPVSGAVGFFSRDMSSQPNSAGVLIPEGAVYLGALSLVAVPFAFFRQGRKDAIFFSILFALAFCSGYGVSIFAELPQKIPVLAGLRRDEELMLAEFSLAVLSGLGVSYLDKLEWKRSIKNVAATMAVLVITTAALHAGVAALGRMTHPGVDWWRSPSSFRVLLIVSALLIGLRLLRLLPRRVWAALAILLIAADLVSFSYAHIPFNRAETIYPRVPLYDFLKQQPKPFRVVALNSAAPLNSEYVYGLATAGGYEYMLSRTSSLTEGLAENPGNGYLLNFAARGIVESKDRILDLLNVRYMVATKFNESDSLLRSIPNRFREVWSQGNLTVFENLNALPKVLIVPQANIERIDPDKAQLDRLRESSFDPAERVILPSSVQIGDVVEIGGSASGLPQVVQYSEDLNSVRVQVNAATPSILVLSQIYYPGWKVYVDGKRAQTLRPDYAFTGVAVDSGNHDIEFKFLPTSFVVGVVISAVSVLFVLFGYVYGSGKEREADS